MNLDINTFYTLIFLPHYNLAFLVSLWSNTKDIEFTFITLGIWFII